MAISASEARSRLFPLIQQVNDDRLVYRADDKEVKILKARYHYSD